MHAPEALNIYRSEKLVSEDHDVDKDCIPFIVIRTNLL